MSRDLLFIAIGALGMFLLVKILSSGAVSGGSTSKAAMNLLKTQQAVNLMLTNEFRELVKTPQFKTLVKTLAANELNALENAMSLKKIL